MAVKISYEKQYKKNLKNCPIFVSYFDKEKTMIFLENFFKKKVSNSFKVWQIINLDLFLRNFN